jgi:hypothetical protein
LGPRAYGPPNVYPGRWWRRPAKGNRREALTLAVQADDALTEASTLLDAATILAQKEKPPRA